MKKSIIFLVGFVQLLLVKISYFLCSLSGSKKESGWVVIAVETASLLNNISKALSGSVSVNFSQNKFYDHSYNYEVYSKFGIINIIQRAIFAPLLLGYLMSRYDRFLYLGAPGFLTPHTDGRAKEFEFIKNKNKKLVCYFLGSEIRSFVLLNKYAKENSLDVVTTYQGISNIGIDSLRSELKRRLLGEAADRYADIIFNASTDQMAYIARATFPVMYFLPDEIFSADLRKFDSVNEIIILHGPSSPIPKGTPIVRAAIKKLQMEGYNFKYIELSNISHEKMLEALKSAHIVLNEFYAFAPGVFGVEALASSCALLTSADINIEKTLFEGANEAWRVTPYWSIYDNLKILLDSPDLIKPQAVKGYKWALKHCTYQAGLEKMNSIVND